MHVVKLCGMTRPADLEEAVRAGADTVGLVIGFPPSPRSLTLERASLMAAAVGIPVTAVMVNPKPDQVMRMVEAIGPANLQLSGRETPTEVARLRVDLPEIGIWKVLHLSTSPSSAELDALLRKAREHVEAGAEVIAVDAGGQKLPGGTGMVVSWEAVREIADRVWSRVVLAGGLTPLNVAAAIRMARPWGVDVSSGIERSPGIKDANLIQRFVREARAAFNGNDPTPPGST